MRFSLSRWFAPLAVFPTVLILGGAMAVATPTAMAAPNETPPAEPSDSPSDTSKEATPADAPPASAEPVSNKAPAAAVHDDSYSVVEPPQPPPPNVEPIPATQASAAFVEHLGPESFPGRLRGLYGGSLWLEPTFHGLQWPYMSHTGIGVSGNFWSDTGYETIKRDLNNLPDSKMYYQQGRGVLRVTPTYVSGRFFIQGQAELVGNLCQTADTGNSVCSTGTFTTDDLWIRFGHWNTWDLKVGRFEGWEIYHMGMGMDPYTFERLGPGMFGVDNPASPKLDVPTLYGVNYMQGRATEGLAVGDVALHFYPTDFLRFEVLTKLGADNYQKNNATGATASTYYGERDTAILDFGWVKFKAGLEYEKRSAVMQDIGASPGETMHKKDAVEQTVRKGAGASLQFVIDPIVEFGLNAAIGRQDDQNSMAVAIKENSYTTKSVGGFANVRFTDLLLFGVGLNSQAQPAPTTTSRICRASVPFSICWPGSFSSRANWAMRTPFSSRATAVLRPGLTPCSMPVSASCTFIDFGPARTLAESGLPQTAGDFAAPAVLAAMGVLLPRSTIL
jgi:hypothetical protein